MRIFLSYPSPEEQVAKKIAVALESDGHSVFVDRHELRAGETFHDRIREGIEESELLVFLITPDSVSPGRYTLSEIELARRKWSNPDGRILPVMIQETPYPSLDPYLTGVTVLEPKGDPAAEVAAAVERLLVEGTVHQRVSISALPSTGSLLVGRDDELAALDEAWRSPEIRVVELVAFGGVGKSTLVNRWLSRLANDEFRGARRVFAWAFQAPLAGETEASGDLFMAEALRWFGDPSPEAGMARDRGERLAELVRRAPTLLILDGLEVLQHPPGEQGGLLHDPGVEALLKSLTVNPKGLCLVTTRFPVEDLSAHLGHAVRRLDLEELSAEAGADLLQQSGVEGTRDELAAAATEYGGHALALTLLASYLVTVHSGDVTRRDRVASLTRHPRQGGHARRLLDTYERWFEDKPEGAILRLLGLFDRPAAAGAIEALLADPPIPELTDTLVALSPDEWAFTVDALRKARLLAPAEPRTSDRAATLDCHPLVREHFAERLQASSVSGTVSSTVSSAEAGEPTRPSYFGRIRSLFQRPKPPSPDPWKAGNERLHRYYSESVPELPDSLAGLDPLYAAVRHGCAAGLHEEALTDVYFARIRRDDNFATDRLGAFGADLAGITGFFEVLWERPVATLKPRHSAYVLNQAGLCLRCLGRLEEATAPMTAALMADVEQEDWSNASIAATNLAQLFLAQGELDAAADVATNGAEAAKIAGDLFQQEVNRCVLGRSLALAGKMREAEATFMAAEQHHHRRTGLRYMYSLMGSWVCDYLLDKGAPEIVIQRASTTLELAREHGALLDVAIDRLSLGRAHLLQGDLDAAEPFIEEAVGGLREAGQLDHLPKGLLARADLLIERTDYGGAAAVLEEVLGLAERSGFRLFEADAHLAYARLQLALGDRERAGEHVEKAAALVEACGYGRRTALVAELLEALGSKERVTQTPS